MRDLWNVLWNTLWRGLVVVVPLALTVYVVYWFGVLIDGGLKPLIAVFVPRQYEWPGIGLLAGFMLVFFIGWALSGRWTRRVVVFAENVLVRIPIVKSIYIGLRDFMAYIGGMGRAPNAQQVVMVTIGNAHLLGLRMAEHVPDMATSEDVTAVYLPMSYQVGGYTVYVPSTQIVPLDISVEDAMRRILTGELPHSSVGSL